MIVVGTLIMLAIVAGYGTGLLFDASAHGDESKIKSLVATGKFDSNWIPYGLGDELKKIESSILTFPFGGGPYLFLQNAYLSDGNGIFDHAQIDFTISTEQKEDGTLINRVTECIFQSEDDIQTECVVCILQDEFQTNLAKGELFFDPPYIAHTVIPLEMTEFLNDDPFIIDVQNVHGVLLGICEMNGAEGCTPGYWKQPQHFDSWVTYDQDDLFSDVFGVGPDITLLQALKTGGGGENALGRHAVAGLLDAASLDLDYMFTQAQVIQMVVDAYTTPDFEGIKSILEEENELICPLN